MRSPVETAIDAVVRCVKCDAKYGECSCWDSQKNALLSIHAGAGGVDAQEWADILRQMYCHWAEKQGYKFVTQEIVKGEEQGIINTTVLVSGLGAYGCLRGENGVHRLVRISPFDTSGRRHTSFALVEIVPFGEQLKENDWGLQLRSYIFDPYKQVKDYRTGFETVNIEAVLDGNIDSRNWDELLSAEK